jgi:2-amino-4-hydroxy-6-hydroxymethyldihydropteridine diphosphokinase
VRTGITKFIAMAKCLLGLGANEGDRAATLASALAAIDALPDVRLRKQSRWHRTEPLGGPPGQGEFLNGAALVETTTPPLILLQELQQIEARHGRKSSERWSPRTIDIDILLYDREVLEQSMITLPHPRMSFRRFMLEPSAEIAAKMIHPIIGWPIERLLLHLDRASDLVAIVSPSDNRREKLAETIKAHAPIGEAAEPALGVANRQWPSAWTTWLAIEPADGDGARARVAGGLPYAAAKFPKLTILADPDPSTPRATLGNWASLVRQPGRGPTLRIADAADPATLSDALAAVAAVWPDLGSREANRLE